VAVEELLHGGNTGNPVVRVGETVRRAAGPWTPSVHALLEHLHNVGFEAAPRPLGIDELGREVLSYVPGKVAWPAHFEIFDDEASLARVGALIRRFHDAVASFVPPPNGQWQSFVAAEGPPETICHNDLGPWNLVVQGETWSFIDWDGAAPGSRLWDLAYAAHGFVPLSANPAFTRDDAPQRLRTLVDGYGLDEAGRRALIPLLARRTRAMADALSRGSAPGIPPSAPLWDDGHRRAWLADTGYILGRQDAFLRALLG
jgi:hypothetical protein